MSVEISAAAEGFGDARLHSYILRQKTVDYRRLGVLIGWSNGCPRPKINMDKAGEEAYCREHAQPNFLWSFILREVAAPLRERNPVLYDDLLNGCEETPSEEDYDADCVPASYLEGKRYGLARDSAYFITQKLASVIGAAHEAGENVAAAFCQEIVYLERLMQDPNVVSTKQIWERFSQDPDVV